VAIASTNSTAAALAVLGRLGRLRDLTGAGRWLLAQQHPLGGFRASPLAPLPDLLSTATALHVLAGIGMELGPLREPCLDFIDSLWSNRGSFHGHWADEQLDVEYTFYGLLALGHLGSK
jgi:prenyltransferase beta subunit